MPTIYRDACVHLSPDPLYEALWGLTRRFCKCSYALVTISCVHETIGEQIDFTLAYYTQCKLPSMTEVACLCMKSGT